ncbi:MAG: cation diffusion facilitator transporter [Betaproteobacteria bacterium]|nr:Zinc transporter ZitB [Rhodocyclaceae bacterium]
MAHGSEGSLRAILYALAANGGIALTKLIAATWTGSGAMLAEAIHSCADCVNQGLLLLGLRQARRPESEDHPLGHHRVVYYWAMLVALMLFFVGGVFSVWEGVTRLRHPEPVENALAALIVLAMAVVLEAFSLWGAMREINRERGRQPLLRWFRDTRQSALMVVAGEDVAALAGLVVALCAVSATLVSGDPVYDALGTLVVGVVLIVVAGAVLREVKALIVGESLAPELRQRMRAHFEAQPEIETVFRIITLAWGERAVVAVKARVRDDFARTGTELVATINRLEARFEAAFPQVGWLFFEPDVR